MTLIDKGELERLEAQVTWALDGEGDGLNILGHGEITLVVGWPTMDPTVAAKRLPPFEDRVRADQYGRLIEEYVCELNNRRVQCSRSEFHVTRSEDGWAAYVVQPLIDPETLGPAALRRLERQDPRGDQPRDLLRSIVTTIVEVVDDHVGLDGQLSNWAYGSDGLAYFDVTTPMLTDRSGHTRLDLDTLVTPLPAPLRPVIRHFVAPGIIGKYNNPRDVLVDLAANLYKERLGHWVDAVLVAANRHVSPPISPEEVQRYYRSDARTWEVLMRLRTADRWWHRRVLHRRYGSLLPLNVER